MIRLLGFGDLNILISFSCNVSCPGNCTLLVQFFLSFLLYIITHCVVVGIYFVDCDVIVIDSVWFTFVSVPTRSWARVSRGPRNIWFRTPGSPPPPPQLASFAFSEPAPIGVQAARSWKSVTVWRRHAKTMPAKEWQ